HRAGVAARGRSALARAVAHSRRRPAAFARPDLGRPAGAAHAAAGTGWAHQHRCHARGHARAARRLADRPAHVGADRRRQADESVSALHPSSTSLRNSRRNPDHGTPDLNHMENVMKLSRIALATVAAAALSLGAIAATPSLAQMKEQTVTVGGAPMYPSKNIVENAVNSKDHTTLVAAVKAAGLVETLQS